MLKDRHLALALALVLTSSVGAAAQQTAVQQPPAPMAPTPAQMNLLNSVVSQEQGALKEAAAAGRTLVARGYRTSTGSVVLGWNYAHATHCGWFIDSSENEWFYIFPQEGGIIYTINDLYTGLGLQVPCGEGYWIGWFVTNTTTGAFVQTYSYSYK